jgi:hypothetical protein
MTNHVARLYTAAISIVVFFLLWVAVAAKPWVTAPSDPRVAALAAREQRLRTESAAVQQVVNARWSAYRRELALRAQTASAVPAPPPPVRVVTLPPATVTRSS